jgi:hypothetical protein
MPSERERGKRQQGWFSELEEWIHRYFLSFSRLG